MVGYRRNVVPGARYFFTVTLADRASHLLVERIADLRAVFRAVRAQRPFAIDAMVVLPDHLHCIWTLPPGDADYALRWRDIKSRFRGGRRWASSVPRGASTKANEVFGNAAIGNIPCETSGMCNGMWIISTTTLLNTGRYRV